MVQRLGGFGVSACEEKGSIAYAFTANRNGPDRSRCSPVAGESFYPHASHHQVDRERRGRHRRGGVAPECVWAFYLALQDPRR